MASIGNSPAKKRRLSSSDAPVHLEPRTTLPIGSQSPKKAKTSQPTAHSAPPSVGGASGFDGDTLAAFIGEQLPEEKLQLLKDASGGSLERAINMYLDGTLQNIPSRQAAYGSLQPQVSRKRSAPEQRSIHPSSSGGSGPSRSAELKSMPFKRYIGAFGVAGWATRSGNRLISHGSKKAFVKQRKTQDIVVRFTSSQGQEVGRLPQETAAWVSTLIDQKLCFFEGVCVYAPERIRTNETIYLQLRCFFLRSAFERKLPSVADSNRVTDLFAAKESEDERAIRLRQVSLVKLFSEINLEPSTATSVAEKQARSALLQVAEEAEKQDGASKDSNNDSEEEEGKELEQDQLDALYKKAQSFDFNSPEAEPADTFSMELRPYQKQALHWLINKEKNTSDRDNGSMHPLWEEYRWPLKDQDDKPIPTVISLDKFYVNPYSGEMSLEFPRQEQNCLGGILADEMGLGKTIEMMSLIHSNKSETKSSKSQNNLSLTAARSTTLVVAPMSLLAQWESEAKAASKPGTLTTYVYYGNDKKTNLESLVAMKNPPDVVITSYGVVLSDYGRATVTGGSTKGGIFGVDFYRVILDEAHHIKSRVSKTARACYEINAHHRWVLTGTPIVNRLEDLFSLVRFLRVDPWQNFSFWKTFITMPFENREFLRALDVVQTVLEPLVLRRTKDMKRPDGQPLVPLPPRKIVVESVKLSKKEREVYDHIRDRAQSSFRNNLESGTLMRAYTTILAQIMRLRQSCCHPNLIRKKEIVDDELEAEAAYDAAKGLSDDMDLNALLDRFSAGNEDEEAKSANSYGAHVLEQIREGASNMCPFCCDEVDNQVVTACFHSACRSCLEGYIEHECAKMRLPLCVTCREPINERDIFEIVKEDADDGDPLTSSSEILLRRINTHSSSKIRALISKLKHLRKTEPATKCCIFSQFTTFLDLIEPALQRERIPFTRFDGSMTQQQRATVLDKFRSHEGRIVLLISLRAGGVGLNLTEAKRVFMMDPWWSFAVEAQAIDRVHRMGQTQEVTVHRFIVEESVEERMVNKIQAKKKFIASSLGMMTDEEKKQARIDDIKDLLSND